MTSQDMVKERFLEFCKLNVNPIPNTIEKQFVKHGWEHLTPVAQAHDGALVISGARVGIRAQSFRQRPEAIVFHCYSNELNLVLCDTCKAVPEARGFLLESVYSFFNTKLVNHDELKALKKQQRGKTETYILGAKPEEKRKRSEKY